MKRLIIILISGFLLCGCSAHKCLKWLVKKNPELMQMDNIRFVDTTTFVTQRVYADTVITLQNITHDTLIVTQENLKIKTFYNYHTDSIFISGECQSDTIIQIKEVEIPYEKIVVEEVKSTWQNPLIVFCILLLILVAILVRRITSKNRFP